jgi:hypothetical protein
VGVPQGLVWVGPYEALEAGHDAYQGLLIGRAGEPDPVDLTIYIVTITAGALILQMAGCLIPELSFDDLALSAELHAPLSRD